MLGAFDVSDIDVVYEGLLIVGLLRGRNFFLYGKYFQMFDISEVPAYVFRYYKDFSNFGRRTLEPIIRV